MFSGELEFLVGRQVEVGAKFDNPLRWWKNFSQHGQQNGTLLA